MKFFISHAYSGSVLAADCVKPDTPGSPSKSVKLNPCHWTATQSPWGVLRLLYCFRQNNGHIVCDGNDAAPTLRHASVASTLRLPAKSHFDTCGPAGKEK